VSASPSDVDIPVLIAPPATLPSRQIQTLAAVRASYLATGELDPSVRPFVAQSWARCRAFDVHPGMLRGQHADAAALRAAQSRGQGLLSAADPILAQVHQVLQGQPHVLALSDEHGLILRVLGDSESLGPTGRAANIFEGASWHERDIGCNGIGSCLEAGEPVVLIGAEHFQEAYVTWTCIGIPLRNRDGAIVGALDFSVPNETVNVHTWGWMLSVSRAIEERLGANAAPRHEVHEQMRRPFHAVRGILEMIARHAAGEGEHAREIDLLGREVAAAEEQFLAGLRVLGEHCTRLEEAGRHKDEFIAALGHELRGPLFALRSCIDLLKRNEGDQETLQWARKVLEHQVTQMRTLVDELLDLARVEHGKMRLNQDDVLLPEAIEQAVQTVRAHAQARHVAIEVSVPRLKLLADRTRLVQILTNLLANAVRYNRDDGRVSVAAAEGPDHIEIRIADTGRGIDREMLPRIFDPFVQGRGERRGGLGIGLALVQRLAHLHGGTVVARSDGEGKGSEFILRLPRSGHSARPAEPTGITGDSTA
jgi:signal transduction histidine kinase